MQFQNANCKGILQCTAKRFSTRADVHAHLSTTRHWSYPSLVHPPNPRVTHPAQHVHCACGVHVHTCSGPQVLPDSAFTTNPNEWLALHACASVIQSESSKWKAGSEPEEASVWWAQTRREIGVYLQRYAQQDGGVEMHTDPVMLRCMGRNSSVTEFVWKVFLVFWVAPMTIVSEWFGRCTLPNLPGFSAAEESTRAMFSRHPAAPVPSQLFSLHTSAKFFCWGRE